MSTLIEIRYYEASKRFHWTLIDGPEGIDEEQGWTFSLQEAFQAVSKARHRIALNYLGT